MRSDLVVVVRQEWGRMACTCAMQLHCNVWLTVSACHASISILRLFSSVKAYMDYLHA